MASAPLFYPILVRPIVILSSFHYTNREELQHRRENRKPLLLSGLS